ncbi:nitroreductase family protein [Mariniblastus sp.]|nr:nitroreductase family protein [Mariniblastus sp.]
MSSPQKSASVFEKIPSVKHVEPAIDTDAGEFEKVVRSRRSTRVYTDEPIPETVVRRCLELATLAPNSSNLQCWEFYWVRDATKKKALVKLCLGQPAAATAQELIVCVARLDTWKRNSKLILEHLLANKSEVPAAKINYQRKIVPMAYSQGPFYLLGPVKKLLIATLGLFRVVPRGPASKADMRVWAHKTTALACENLMLAFRAFGFDSCPMEGMDERRVQKLLEIPRAAEVCMVISAGKRAKHGVYDKQFRCDPSLFIFEI